MAKLPQDESALRIDEGERWIQELNEELKKGKWDSICRLISDHGNESFKTKLNNDGDTLLLSAFKGGKKGLSLINNLVDRMRPDLLAETDKFGNTALHLAANVGVVEDAKRLVEKNHELLNILNKDGLLPIQMALSRRDLANAHKMTSYFLRVMKDAAGASVMQSLVKAGFYDLALDLLQYNEKLAWEGDISPLQQMASDPGGFRSGCRLSGWQSLIYSSTHIDFTANRIEMTDNSPHAKYKMILSKVLAKVLVQNMDIPALVLKHHRALQLVKSLCSIIITKSDSFQAELQKPFLLGAQNGVEEIVHEILHSFPTAINYTDEERRSVFHVAVIYRHENILKIAHEKNMEHKGMYVEKLDKYKNNILHLVGYKPRLPGIHTDHSGAIFQMQRELQWFMKVTELVTPQESTSRNEDGKIPFTIFEEEHAEMAKTENDWMTGMATASSVAASLVATVAFSAAFQVPGGNNNNGIPNFSNETSFKVFAISDALALFSSITSVLSFLSIFTSRYGVQDYLRALPHRVIIGLISLLLSSIFLIIAFSSTLFLVFAKQNVLLLIPIIILSCIPVVLYAILQLPSLIAMIKSTIYPSILHW